MNIFLRSCFIAFIGIICGFGYAHSAEIWERTGSFDGELTGTITSLGLAGNGHVFACIFNGAPTYRSIDHGVTWQKSSLPKDNYLNAFAAKDSIILGASLKGIYRSTNNGATWKLSNTGLTSLNVRAVQFAPHGIAVFAGTHDGGVFRSLDSGLTWQAVNSGLAILRISALAILDSTSLLAATDGEGVFLSTNSGDSWQLISSDVRLNNVRSLAVNFAGVIFAGTDQYGLFRNATHGDTWDYMPTDVTSSVNAILCKQNEVYAATGLHGVFHSGDNGDSWISDNTGIEGNVSYCLALNALDQVLVGANGGAVYRRVSVNSVDEDALFLRPSIDGIFFTNSELRIPFTMPLASRATFSVYSILGENIAIFDALTYEKGAHEFRTAAGHWSRGTYLCRMETPLHSIVQVFQIP